MTDQTNQRGHGYVSVAAVFLVIGLALGLYGIYRMYSYSADDQIVGGDAYNYAILAARGTGLICAGVLAAAVAGVFMLMRVAALATPPSEPETVTARDAAPAALQPGERTIVCWNCGKDYGERAAECPHCGKAKALIPVYR